VKKTLLYRFFGLGKIPAQYASALQSEGLILADEGVKGTVTLLNFRSPNRIANWKRQWYSASIALTAARLLAFQYSSPIIDVPFADARFRELKFSVEPDGALLVAFDAALFHHDWSGRIEYRFFTPPAPQFLDQLTQRREGAK
jgi:hypothetical protein